MKRAWMLVLTISLSFAAAEEPKTPAAASEVIHVATAMDHLTVLEFNEPVTMAAAGSGAFQIERYENKVFLKPLKPGLSTDLFVWTGSRRYAYELEPAGEVNRMNFALDGLAAVPAKLTPDSLSQVEEIADMVLTHAYLGAQRVNNIGIKNTNGRVIVRIEHTLRSKNNFYIHFAVRNLTEQRYEVRSLSLYELLAPNRMISLPALEHEQLDPASIRKLGKAELRTIPVVRWEIQKEKLQPEEETEGILSIREQIASQTILQLTFDTAGGRPIFAVVVL